MVVPVGVVEDTVDSSSSGSSPDSLSLDDDPVKRPPNTLATEAAVSSGWEGVRKIDDCCCKFGCDLPDVDAGGMVGGSVGGDDSCDADATELGALRIRCSLSYANF